MVSCCGMGVCFVTMFALGFYDDSVAVAYVTIVMVVTTCQNNKNCKEQLYFSISVATHWYIQLICANGMHADLIYDHCWTDPSAKSRHCTEFGSFQWFPVAVYCGHCISSFAQLDRPVHIPNNGLFRLFGRILYLVGRDWNDWSPAKSNIPETNVLIY